jgi:IS30 family transposase
MPDDVRGEICERVRGGLSWAETAAVCGVSRSTVARVMRDAGGMPIGERCCGGRWLSLAEREEIRAGLVEGVSLAAIGRRLGRPTSTVSREVARNGGRQRYLAWVAQRRAGELCRRPRAGKLAVEGELREFVIAGLQRRWSPQQIAARLVVEFADRPEMRVSHETIYQSLFIQARGQFRKQLTSYLRSARSQRRPHGEQAVRQPIANMISISQRPAEADDRAVPGHWEGDLMMGAYNRSAIVTLVERSSRYVLLARLEGRHDAVTTCAALTATITKLPTQLRRSLTWDQGREMAGHANFTIATDVAVYFCDPHSPWQRGSNENTNGLLRQYFPKGTDLSRFTQADLDTVAHELNGRPRQTLAWKTPTEKLNELVATTT